MLRRLLSLLVAACAAAANPDFDHHVVCQKRYEFESDGHLRYPFDDGSYGAYSTCFDISCPGKVLTLTWQSAEGLGRNVFATTFRREGHRVEETLHDHTDSEIPPPIVLTPDIAQSVLVAIHIYPFFFTPNIKFELAWTCSEDVPSNKIEPKEDTISQRDPVEFSFPSWCKDVSKLDESEGNLRHLYDLWYTGSYFTSCFYITCPPEGLTLSWPSLGMLDEYDFISGHPVKGGEYNWYTRLFVNVGRTGSRAPVSMTSEMGEGLLIVFNTVFPTPSTGFEMTWVTGSIKADSVETVAVEDMKEFRFPSWCKVSYGLDCSYGRFSYPSEVTSSSIDTCFHLSCPGEVLTLKWDSLSLHSSDFVVGYPVVGGDYDFFRELFKYTHTTAATMPTVISPGTGDGILFEFRSDNPSSTTGFEVSWTTTPSDTTPLEDSPHDSNIMPPWCTTVYQLACSDALLRYPYWKTSSYLFTCFYINCPVEVLTLTWESLDLLEYDSISGYPVKGGEPDLYHLLFKHTAGIGSPTPTVITSAMEEGLLLVYSSPVPTMDTGFQVTWATPSNTAPQDDTPVEYDPPFTYPQECERSFQVNQVNGSLQYGYEDFFWSHHTACFLIKCPERFFNLTWNSVYLISNRVDILNVEEGRSRSLLLRKGGIITEPLSTILDLDSYKSEGIVVLYHPLFRTPHTGFDITWSCDAYRNIEPDEPPSLSPIEPDTESPVIIPVTENPWAAHSVAPTALPTAVPTAVPPTAVPANKASFELIGTLSDIIARIHDFVTVAGPQGVQGCDQICEVTPQPATCYSCMGSILTEGAAMILSVTRDRYRVFVVVSGDGVLLSESTLTDYFSAFPELEYVVGSVVNNDGGVQTPTPAPITPTDDGLSKGAIIGITAAGVAAIIIAVLVLCWCRQTHHIPDIFCIV